MKNSDMLISQILDQLNSEVMIKNSGGIVFISILMVTGFIGNLHVLVVYTLRMKPSNHRTFICCLAIVDMIACVVAMPFTLVNLTKPLTFDNSNVCRVMITLNYGICSSCGIVLVVISIDRYRKICHPLEWQLSHRVAMIACILAVVVSVALSSPAFFLFGYSTVETRYTNITGVRCSTDDRFNGTNYPTIFNLVLIVLVSGAVCVVAVLYALISRVMLKRGKQGPSKRMGRMNKHIIKRKQNNLVAEAIFSTTNVMPNYGELIGLSVSSDKYTMPDDRSDNTEFKCHIHVKHRASKHKETRRITVTFFIIIAVYMLSYIPILILKIIAFINTRCFQNLSIPSAVVLNIFNRFFFVNNVANPMIYLFLDLKYRAELKKFYGKLCK